VSTAGHILIEDYALRLTPEYHEESWYALHIRPKHEKRVAEELKTKRIEAYVPIVSQLHRWSDRRKTVQVPLFPCYGFVRTALKSDARLLILRTWGVLGLVGPRNQAAPIPDSEINAVQALLTSQLSFTPHPFLTVGQRVRVCSGPLKGTEGILLRNGERRLVISVESIERSLSISVEPYDVEPV
jgi:transcription antitermination factor NusG